MGRELSRVLENKHLLKSVFRNEEVAGEGAVSRRMGMHAVSYSLCRWFTVGLQQILVSAEPCSEFLDVASMLRLRPGAEGGACRGLVFSGPCWRRLT